MKVTIPLFILFFLFTVSVKSQNNDVLITIDETEVTRAEFERIYRKNNQNLLEESDLKSPQEYLDLYIDFKLKVIEAMNLKMDTVKTFREELAGYRKELAAPYLTDMQFDETLTKELYRRMTKEVNASHILFLLDANAATDKEEEVLEKALKVRGEILAGKNFEAAAVEYSEDPSAQNNQGRLGYFSAFQMVAPFENAAFNSPEGAISKPVRTSFGYHLIKVNDVRENLGEIKVSHIMKMFPQTEENFDKAILKTEIDAIYEELLNGADFAELAKQHSDDKRSAAEGGEMPWFSAGRMIPEFSEPAFALKNTGDFTEPIETAFGYHIIKKTGHRPVPPFEELRNEIEERIKRDPERSSSTKKAFIEKLKTEYGFQEWDDDEIIAYEDARLEQKYPEFRYLMQEYHDGLLLFNIMEEKIWKFASEDSIGLEKYYHSHKDKFQWEERFKGMIITCKNGEVRKEAEKYFEAGLTSEEVEDLLNKKEKMVEIQQGAWENGSNQIVNYFVWNTPAPAGFNPELIFIRGDLIPSQPKTLQEARGMYISEYQSFLEKEWLKALRKKYKIKVNKKLLKTIPHV